MNDKAKAETQVTEPAEKGTRPHDGDLPEKFLEFMRSGWADATLDVAPLPQGNGPPGPGTPDDPQLQGARGCTPVTRPGAVESEDRAVGERRRRE